MQQICRIHSEQFGRSSTADEQWAKWFHQLGSKLQALQFFHRIFAFFGDRDSQARLGRGSHGVTEGPSPDGPRFRHRPSRTHWPGPESRGCLTAMLKRNQTGILPSQCPGSGAPDEARPAWAAAPPETVTADTGMTAARVDIHGRSIMAWREARL